MGATSGIGEYTAKAFAKHAVSPRIYIVGRSQPAAERIIAECKALNETSTISFLKADCTQLGEVDRVCKEIAAKESHINLIVQSQGNLTLKGRTGILIPNRISGIALTVMPAESHEGMDRKFTLNYFSRMRFITNLLPQLQAAASSPPHFSRTLSILGAGHEGTVNFSDLDLSKSYSGQSCANHTIVMNDFFAEELAKRNPGTSFIHSSPGIVMTNIARELPLWARVGLTLFKPAISLLSTSQEETGERQLFLATSGLYPPAKPAASASGVKIPAGQKLRVGSNGSEGSGAYLSNWDNEPAGKVKLLAEYRAEGKGKTIWDWTMDVFQRVEKINTDRGATK